MSWSENLHVLKNLAFSFSSNFCWQFLLQHKNLYSIKSLLKFVYSVKESQHLYLIAQVSHFLSSCPYLHLSLWIPSERLLTRFYDKLAINLALSINCNMLDIFFVISSPFLSILLTSCSIESVKLMYFSVISPKQVNYFLNSSANSLMIKWYS